jgi:MFS family permease
VDEIQDANPGIFGPNGGYSRAISVVSVSWTLGMFFGPILSGYATEQIGYYKMNCLLGLSAPVKILQPMSALIKPSGDVCIMLCGRLLEPEVCAPTVCK